MPTINEGGNGEQQSSIPPSDAIHNLQDDAKALFETAREQGSEHLDEYRERAADEIENLARSATSAAEQLQDHDTLGLSHYITDVAEGLGNFAGSLRGKSADELLQQVGRLARDNPALFLTGSIALGFGLSRFMRASNPDLAQTGSQPPTDNDVTTSEGDSGGAEFDPRIAADLELAVRPAHEDDVKRSFADGDSGIQQSGAEMGSFVAPPLATPDPTTPEKSVGKGEL